MTPLEQDLYDVARRCPAFQVAGNCANYARGSVECLADGPGLPDDEARALALDAAGAIAAHLSTDFNWIYRWDEAGEHLEALGQACKLRDGTPAQPAQPTPKGLPWPWIAGGAAAVFAVGVAVVSYRRNRRKKRT